MNFKIFINHKFLTKLLIALFLLSIFSYVFYFSLKNIINYWTFTEIHINYSLGFSKRGLLGSIMLYLESIGIQKKIFFSTLFYLVTICNIFLFLNLLNRLAKNHIIIYIFFALNPALILFSFYDLGGYARSESFGLLICMLHALFAQNLRLKKINFQKYLKLSLIFIYPLYSISVLIHELNLLFISFHFFTTFLISQENQFKNIKNHQSLIITNSCLIITIIIFLFLHPFTKEFAKDLYNYLPTKGGTSFWIWSSIAGSFSERMNSEIDHMLNPAGAISLYISIFAFYAIPIFFLLTITTKKNKFYLIFIFLSTMPFLFLFLIGRDWGRWINILTFIIFLCLIQFKNKKIKVPQIFRFKILNFALIAFIIFQFTFTRIPHCCNLVKLNLNIFGGILPKIEVFYEMLNNTYDIKKRFEVY